MHRKRIALTNRSSGLAAVALSIALGTRAHAEPSSGASPAGASDERATHLRGRGSHYHVAGGIVAAVGAATLTASIIAFVPHSCDPAGGDCAGADLVAAMTIGSSAIVFGTGLLLYHHGTELIDQANAMTVAVTPVANGVELVVAGHF